MADIHVSLTPEVLTTVAGIPITNSYLASTVISIILMVLFVFAAKKMKSVPKPFQLFVETFVLFSYTFVHGITNNERATQRMYPLFATMALFFLASNLIGMIPGLTAFYVNDAVIYRAPTTDYSMIFGITMVMFVAWQMIAIVSGGLLGYIGKFFNFKSPMDFIMGILDIIGEIAKIVSLSFRLFGNIFAGEVIATVLLSLAPYLVPIPFAFLGLLSSVIQAFVFPILVMIFMNMSIIMKEEREKEEKTEPAKQDSIIVAKNSAN